MMTMHVMVMFLVFIISLYMISTTPMEYMFLTLILAFSTAGYLTCMFSSWFAMILFLIYVGGMLVLFIYLCMISSNFMPGVLYMSLWKLLMVGVSSFSISWLINVNYKSTYYASLLMTGSSFKLSIILFLVLLLLLVFLGMVKMLSPGGMSLKISG